MAEGKNAGVKPRARKLSVLGCVPEVPLTMEAVPDFLSVYGKPTGRAEPRTRLLKRLTYHTALLGQGPVSYLCRPCRVAFPDNTFSFSVLLW